MHLVDTLRSLLRRWYIFLLGLILSAGMGYAAYTVIQPTYEAQSTLLLMPPAEVVGEHSNPYLYLGGMNEALDVLVRRASAPEAITAIEEQFGGVTVTPSADRTTSSPIVVITITGPDAQDVLNALDAGRMTVIRNLDSMQNELDIEANMRITTKDLVLAHEATANRKMPIQLAILVVAAGSVGTLMFTGFIDGQLIARAQPKKQPKRKNKRARQDQPAVENSEDTTPEYEQLPKPDARPLVDATANFNDSGPGSR